MKNNNYDNINYNDHEYYEMLISCQIDGELSKEEELELEEHLATCEECRKLQSQFGGMSEILNGDKIVQDVEGSKNGRKLYLDFHKKHFPFVKAAACVLIMLALSITTFVGVNNHNRISTTGMSEMDGYLMSDTFASYVDSDEEYLSDSYSEEYSPLVAYFSYLDEE